LADAATDTAFDTGTAPSSFAGIGGSAGALPNVKTDSIDDMVAGITPDKRKKLEGRLESLQARQVGLEGAMEADETRRSKQYRDRMDEMVAREGASINDLKPWNAEKELAERKTGLWDQFGSPGFIVSMLASAFTAHPMNSALTSGAAAMNAINQGDMAAYDKAMEAWKANTDIAIKRMNMEHEEFQDIDKLRSSDLQEWQARMKMAMLKFNDQRGLALMEAGMYPELDEKIAGMAKAKEQLAASRTAIFENWVRQHAIMDSAEGRSGDPQQILRKTYEVDAAMAEAKKGGTEFTIQDQYGKHKIRAIPDGQGGWKDPISGKPIDPHGGSDAWKSLFKKPAEPQPAAPEGKPGVEGALGPTEAKPDGTPQAAPDRNKRIQLAMNDENTPEARQELAQILSQLPQQDRPKEVLRYPALAPDGKGADTLPPSLWQKPFGDRQFNESALDDMTPSGRALVRGMVEGKIAPPSSFLLGRSEFWNNVLQKAMEYDPSFDEKIWPVRLQTMKEFLNGTTAKNQISRYNTLIGSVSRLEEAATALDNYKSTQTMLPTSWWNRAKVGIAGQYQDPKLNAVRTDINAVATEAAGAFRSVGMAEKDIDHWRSTMSEDMSLDGMRAHVYEILQLAKKPMSTTVDRWNKTFSANLPGEALLSPEVRGTFHRLTTLQEARDMLEGNKTEKNPHGDKFSPHEVYDALVQEGVDPHLLYPENWTRQHQNADELP
jgi:hypothetical protein